MDLASFLRLRGLRTSIDKRRGGMARMAIAQNMPPLRGGFGRGSRDRHRLHATQLRAAHGPDGGPRYPPILGIRYIRRAPIW